MATEERGGIVDGIRVDVRRLHETWMELVFPRQRGAEHSVLGKWQPTERVDRIKYRVWSVLGVPLIAVLYPLLLFGFAARFYSRRFDSVQTRLGLVGVVVVAALVWGVLTLVAWFRGFPLTGVKAVLAASVVAVVSAGLSVVFVRVGGRGTTILLAYPFAMNAVFLPPIIAAYYAPSLSFVFAESTELARWLRTTFLPPSVADWFVEQFDLKGLAFLVLWVGIAVPLGWLLGIVVTLADLVRPKGDDDSGTNAQGEDVV